MAKPYERRTRFYPDPRRSYERMISLETPLKRDQLEAYEDNLPWEMIRGTAVLLIANDKVNFCVAFPTSYLNKGIQGWVSHGGGFCGRAQDASNFYRSRCHQGAATADFKLEKVIADVETLLASEAVDIGSKTNWEIKLEIVNSTLKGYRENMTTPKITTTDTDIAIEGKWGVWDFGDTSYRLLHLGTLYSVKLVTPTSPSPKVLRYYEVPVIGDGSIDNPFRPQLPKEIVDHPFFGKVNRLAISWGAIIPTYRKTGKPKDYVALVEIFHQPVRQDHLRSIRTCLEALEAISGVKRLRKDIFERRKKRLLEI